MSDIIDIYSQSNFSQKQKLLPQITEGYRKNMEGVKNFGLSTRSQVLQILQSENTDCFVTLCPVYSDQGISTEDYGSFSDIPHRFQMKCDQAISGAKLLSSLFSINIKLLLADRGILIDPGSPEYNIKNIDADIERTQTFYQNRARDIFGEIPFEILTFSDIGIPIDRISPPDFLKTRGDIDVLLRGYAIDPEKFRSNTDIIIASFGLEKSYGVIQSYLKESQFLQENYKNTLLLNTEFCSSLNSLYGASDDLSHRLNQSLLFARLDLTISKK